MNSTQRMGSWMVGESDWEIVSCNWQDGKSNQCKGRRYKSDDNSPSQGKSVLISSIPVTEGSVWKMVLKGRDCIFFLFSKGEAKGYVKNNVIKILYTFPRQSKYFMMYAGGKDLPISSLKPKWYLRWSLSVKATLESKRTLDLYWDYNY